MIHLKNHVDDFYLRVGTLFGLVVASFSLYQYMFLFRRELSEGVESF